MKNAKQVETDNSRKKLVQYCYISKKLYICSAIENKIMVI